MQTHDIRARRKRPYKATTNSKHKLPVAENMLAPEFKTESPDQVWTVDITYIPTGEGWLYLAVVMNLYSRMIVGWAMDERMTRALAMDALRMAKFRRKPTAGLLHHSDAWQPVLQRRLSGAIDRIRHALLDESQGKLLGQRADGKLLQQSEKRTGIP